MDLLPHGPPPIFLKGPAPRAQPLVWIVNCSLLHPVPLSGPSPRRVKKEKDNLQSLNSTWRIKKVKLGPSHTISIDSLSPTCISYVIILTTWQTLTDPLPETNGLAPMWTQFLRLALLSSDECFSSMFLMHMNLWSFGTPGGRREILWTKC